MHDVSPSSAVRWHAWPESKHAASSASGQAGSTTPPLRPLSSLAAQAIESTPALTVPAAAAQLDRMRTLARDLPAVARLLGRRAPSEVGLLQEAWKQAQGLAPTPTSQLAEQSRRLHALARSVSTLATRDAVRRAPAGEGMPARQTLESLAGLLREQARHVDHLINSSPFNARRVHEARAALWEAAADLLRGDQADLATAQPGAALPPELAARRAQLERAIHTFEARAAFLRWSAEPGRAGTPLLDAPDVAKPRKTKAGSAKMARAVEGILSPPAGSGVRTAQAARAQARALDATRIDERELVLATTARVRRDAGIGGDGPVPLKARFKACLSAVLNRRDNPRVSHALAVPVRVAGGDERSATAEQVTVTCRQDPAHALTDALGRAYARDGIQGANCHDSRQHRHATNLYRSSFEGPAGQPLLSLARHGVHSVSALTPEGIRALSDPELGRIALDLVPECADPVLVRLKESQDPGAEAQAGAYVRWATRWKGIPAYLRTRTAPGLLDRLRAVANERRAREAAEVAATCLPAAELARIQAASRAGEVPTLRLASVSVLTPDAFRGALMGPEMDERRMWNDQRAAWQALAGASVVLALPATDATGALLRDAEGRLQTRLTRVALQVATFNLPVNEAGTGRFARVDAVTGSDLAAPANAAAIRMLLGDLPPTAPRLRGWQPGGWVGEALRARGSADAAARQASAELRALARQVARLYLTGEHLGRDADPYGLVKRLLVLVHQTGIAAPLLNCKSGKDRTSEAETQARQLALEMAATGRAPAPDARVDEVQARQLWHLHQGGGSREIQAWNTGHAGTKLKHPALADQYGFAARPDLRRDYLGMSAHVSS